MSYILNWVLCIVKSLCFCLYLSIYTRQNNPNERHKKVNVFVKCLLLSKFPGNCLITLWGSKGLSAEGQQAQRWPTLCVRTLQLSGTLTLGHKPDASPSALLYVDHLHLKLDNIHRNYKQIIYYMIIILP